MPIIAFVATMVAMNSPSVGLAELLIVSTTVAFPFAGTVTWLAESITLIPWTGLATPLMSRQQDAAKVTTPANPFSDSIVIVAEPVSEALTSTGAHGCCPAETEI